MESKDKQTVKKLNIILERTYDAEQGFAKAAQECKAKSLARWFNDRAVDRSRFAEELKKEIHSMGGENTDKGSLRGDVHRTWMDIKALFAHDNDEAMLDEVLKGEKSALKDYEEILNLGDLPRTATAMLTSQMAQIDYGLVMLSSLKELEFGK
ncbi:PA2169 family four-helix-bundle protein [Flavobacteriaceae bacterium F89]|uniref:PA2169 family four-helix-bundle protein n=1 Tax=Cerina litoralis TaxID=2874477 RepID=A0AAE3JPT9_9FLAO|nr:PA2169 family four-helix-bundle protein [Cerina litoralis]MCG2462465.1 PA2169 family four-helix-bundle protein [Cerina litoralis]